MSEAAKMTPEDRARRVRDAEDHVRRAQAALANPNLTHWDRMNCELIVQRGEALISRLTTPPNY